MSAQISKTTCRPKPEQSVPFEPASSTSAVQTTRLHAAGDHAVVLTIGRNVGDAVVQTADATTTGSSGAQPQVGQLA